MPKNMRGCERTRQAICNRAAEAALRGSFRMHQIEQAKRRGRP